MKKINVQENKITNKHKYPTAHGFMETSNIITNGKKIKTNQNILKSVAGNNHVPTILRIKIALNKINKLKNIDTNFNKTSIANFAPIICPYSFLLARSFINITVLNEGKIEFLKKNCDFMLKCVIRK